MKNKRDYNPLLDSDINFLINESLSVSETLKDKSNILFSEIQKDIDLMHRNELFNNDISKKYSYIRGNFISNIFKSKLNLKYLIINLIDDNYFNSIYKEIIKKIPNSYFSSENKEIFITLFAINNKIVKNEFNKEHMFHELEHAYQDSLVKNVMKNNIYEFILKEIEDNKYDNENIYFKVASSLYITTKCEMDAFIQQMQSQINSFDNIMFDYKKTDAYHNTIYLKNTINLLKSLENKTLIDNRYKSINLTANKIEKILQKGLKYYQLKIGKVLAYIDKKSHLDTIIREAIKGI